MGAEALYTITTLRHTRSSVAVNRMRSDLSFRANFRLFPLQPDRGCSETSHGTELESLALSGQQSSVGRGRRHQLPRPGRPGFPAASPSPRWPTDDSSLFRAPSTSTLPP